MLNIIFSISDVKLSNPVLFHICRFYAFLSIYVLFMSYVHFWTGISCEFWQILVIWSCRMLKSNRLTGGLTDDMCKLTQLSYLWVTQWIFSILFCNFRSREGALLVLFGIGRNNKKKSYRLLQMLQMRGRIKIHVGHVLQVFLQQLLWH